MSPITDYAPFLNPVSANRKPSAIRALQPLLQIPGMISLGGGMPHPDTFPFQCMSVTLKDGSTLELDDKDTALALQYSATNGIPELLAFLRRLQWDQHAPLGYSEKEDFELCTFNGSQDGLAKAFEMLVSPGDHVLVETPMYSGALAIVKPMNCTLVPVSTDEHGIQPDQLETILKSYATRSPSERPKVLYSVPVACNPTGASTPFERKQKIYQLAQQYNLLILEDDPYFYLQFQEGARTRSYLSMDVDRRVLRFDSFSKILSSGMRLGFATGPKPLLERLVLHSQSTSLHTNGITQMLVVNLFRKWQLEGFLAHVQNVSHFYRTKRDMMLRAAETHLGNGNLAEWHVPTAGMFLWMRLRAGVQDSKALIAEKAVEKKVILLPGVEFYPNGGTSAYVRAAYSTASEEQMNEAMKRLAELLKSHQG